MALNLPAGWLARIQLHHPGVLLLLASDLMTIAGLVFWAWDAFLVLILYWFETAVIGFWTILSIATLPRSATSQIMVGESGRVWSGPALALFFVFHAGVFMSVHFMFVWALFAGTWPLRIRGPADFIRDVVIAAGLWLPLLFLFVARLLWFITERTGWDPRAFVETALWGRRVSPAVPPLSPQAMLFGFYGRIVLMQIAIIIGAMLALALGSIAPLIVMVTIRMFFDLATSGNAAATNFLRSSA